MLVVLGVRLLPPNWPVVCPAVYRLLGLLVELLKLSDPLPKFDEFRIDCLRPNCALVFGVTPGAYIYPVSVMVY